MMQHNSLPELVQANVDGYSRSINSFLQQTKVMPLAFIIGESGSGKTCLANLALPGALYPTAREIAECDNISEDFSGADIVIDDIELFDADKIHECILAVRASGHKIIITANPAEHTLCTGLFSRLPVPTRCFFARLHDRHTLQEMKREKDSLNIPATGSNFSA
ncbi:hypothetical protein ACRFV7_005206 [Klebsiella oxytoca]|uniref:Sigma-54 factor interaction domain-containing protein n=5 Tax=Klebsiella/Raoultella group TaxID=2890311 RepID=A0A7H0EW28_KLEVA|nr:MULTISPECIES: hypothetical protein [Enterobacteriaceae]AGO89065.1 hypothetical protein pKpNDM1_00174 [Raoultella planticola]ANS55354.1 hypothetical protein [Klebsiella pneumoniae]ASI56961.1 hypothetical protein CA210_01440 [Raoultella ornithinolytica]AUH88294.1 hypothetical protein CYE04_27500 [Klebsiella pneumoniae]AUT25339.1 hypothetical protein CEA73_27485 [Klebsiella pneumoniae]